MRRAALVPVQAGDLTVQLVAEYEGLDVVGRVVRIENSSTAPVEITEGRIAPSDAPAVSSANPKLAPRQATSAYVDPEGWELIMAGLCGLTTPSSPRNLKLVTAPEFVHGPYSCRRISADPARRRRWPIRRWSSRFISRAD